MDQEGKELSIRQEIEGAMKLPADDASTSGSSEVVEKPAAESKESAPSLTADQKPGTDSKDTSTSTSTEAKPSETTATTSEASAPQSWSPEAKAEFDKLSPTLKAEIQKRESDMHRALTKQDEYRLYGKNIKETLKPYMPLIAQSGMAPEKYVHQMIHTIHQLQTGNSQQRIAIIADVARSFGLKANFEGQSSLDPQAEAELNQLRYRDAERKYEISQQQSQEDATIHADIEAFASNPENKHYESVKSAMAALLMSGEATDLKDAYDKAIWARPDIRSTLVSQQIAAEQAKQKQQTQTKTQQALRAGSSLSGHPGLSVPAAPEGSESDLRSEIRKSLRRSA